MDAAALNPDTQGEARPRWQAVFARLLITEGSRYVNNPADAGGPTRYGLSLRYLLQQERIDPAIAAELDIGHDGPVTAGDVAGMAVATASDLYFRFFWPVAAQLPAPIDAAVFDQTVNDGLTPAVRLLQQAVNAVRFTAGPIDEDGLFGPATRQRVLDVAAYAGVSAIIFAYRNQAASRYRAIVARDPSQGVFLNGWLARAAELGNV